MKLGKKIYELRKKKGLSQEELGEKINVTRQTISNWELGETYPNPEQLKKLSNELNISIDELLDNDVSNVLIEKVSNTEKLAGLILKIIKVFIFIIIFVIIGAILLKVIRSNEDTGRELEKSIYCKIYDEYHSYNVYYQELTGKIIAEGGDPYFNDILNLSKYDYALQVLNIINDYVKKNGGTCNIIDDNDLNDIVNIYIKEGSLTKTGATVLIEEKVDYDISYGQAFWLEKYNYKTNSFDVLKVNEENNCAFNMIAYGVKSGDVLELNQGWSCMYGELEKGQYKLVKKVSFESDRPIDENDYYYIWTEFSID